jgi:hypothetical protein
MAATCRWNCELKGHRAELVALPNYNGNDGGGANRPSHTAPQNGGVSWTESVADYKEVLEQFRKLSAFILSRHRHDQAIWAAEMFLREWGALASEFGWTAEDIFMRPCGNKSGLAYWLETEIVTALGPEHAVTERDRVFDRL